MLLEKTSMTGLEIDNFYKLDNKEYILEKNFEFMIWYNKKINEGYQPLLTLNELQNMIGEIVSFFEFKYHDNMILEMKSPKKSKEYFTSLEISRKLGIDELKYRLHHDYVQFLECPYPRYFELKKKREHLWDLTSLLIFVEPNGTIEDRCLSDLKDYEYLEDTYGIKKVSDLLGSFLEKPTNIDYSELKRTVYNHKTNLELRTKVLELTALAMLYSNNSLPTYSYSRIKNFVRMFNEEYNLNLDTTKIEQIMSLDYQNINYSMKGKVKRLLKKM